MSLSRLLFPGVLAWAVLLAACDSTVEVAGDAVACAGVRCTAGECYATGGQPACRCGPWEEAAKVSCAVSVFEAPDDHGGSPGDATVLTLPMAPRTGRIDEGTRNDMVDRDLFAFTVDARHAYAFRCGMGTLDHCGMRLLDASGRTVPVLERLEGRVWVGLVLLDAGTWYMEVSATKPGTYTYQLVDLGRDDHGDIRTAATVLQSSREPFPVQHSFLLDRDVFTFRVAPDHGYRFSCQQPGGIFQELRLSRANGAEVDYLPSPDSNLVSVGGRALFAEDWFVELRASSFSYPSTSSCRFEDLGRDEHSDVTLGATPVTPGVAVPVTFQWEQDVDVLSFTNEPGHRYVLRTEPLGPWDVQVTSDGLPGWQGTTDTVTVKSPVRGTYFLQIQGGPPSLPSFLFAVVDLGLDDHGDDASQATPFAPGDVITGRFEAWQDTDAFSFDAEAGGIYLADCKPVCLMTPEPADSERVGFLSVEPGRYLVDSRGAGRIALLLRQTGDVQGYTLRVTPVATDDHGDTPLNAASLTLPVSVSGVLQTQVDVDAFTVQLQGGRSYRLSGSQDGLRRTLTAPEGFIVTPRAGIFVAPSTGTYLLTVSGASGLEQSPWSLSLQAL